MRVPSGDLCCVIDPVGCDCSCDGDRLTGVMHFGYMRRAAMLVGDMRCDFLATGEMHARCMQCKHMLAPRGMISWW